MTRWDEDEFTANDLLLDRELIDSRGMPAGRVDDLELTVPGPAEPPVLTALLCGATAFGPRLGGRLGTWWQAIGRRLRPVTGSYPNRIAAELIDHVNRLEITLLTPRENLDSYRFRQWTEERSSAGSPGTRNDDVRTHRLPGLRRGARTTRHDDDYDDELADSADDELADRDDGLTAAQAARAAQRQIAALTGKQIEGITGVEPDEDGWAVGIEVVEDRRIPSSSDILAAYETALDLDGELLSYRRVRRYARGRTDHGT